MKSFTPSQKNIIEFDGRNLLVSASAGTGKTTVMIERIAKLIADGADVSQFAVVTFTNLAAAEMKSRLAAKLTERRSEPHIVEQLEKLDNASICTMHSFCSELLRNYFYVVDIDPSFVILDSVTVATLRESALEETFRDYFRAKDADFKQVYKIFYRQRQDESFKEALMNLYDFSRCLENFSEWYNRSRENFVTYDENNPIAVALLEDIGEKMAFFRDEMLQIAERCDESGAETCATICRGNAQTMNVDDSSLENALNWLYSLKILSFGKERKLLTDEKAKKRFEDVRDKVAVYIKNFSKITRGRPFSEVWEETSKTVAYTDKLVEILGVFEEKFALAKKQRGGVDFNDLEHLTLKLLNDEEAAQAVRQRYKYVFVDEYQDTNPIQEAIVSKLSAENSCKTFMVGDIKQSIYGFRGCDPMIFLQKYQQFQKESAGENRVEKLNQNFRSNVEILNFVNDIFNCLMTDDLGKVNYRETSQLEGDFPPVLNTPSVQIDFVLKQKAEEKFEADDFYDITKQTESVEYVTQGEVIAQKISRFVGMRYKENDESKTISYGDIVILVRNLKEGSVEIYNSLVEHNIPVTANFKTKSFANKETREIINLLRTVDNPYNDIYTVGACLSPMIGFDHNMLAKIKIATDSERLPFYTRMQRYAKMFNDETSEKVNFFVNLTEQLRFYSHAATVDEVVLKILQLTQYQLYVQGFPNGALRLRKLLTFVDGLKGATYAQSVDKFLYFLDKSEQEEEESVDNTNAVRILTMHSSKGLEFPIVIVADAQTEFRFDNYAVNRNSHFGLAMKYYDFENMRVFDTLGSRACVAFNHKATMEEEMRLLYVALTRAKSVLCIVGTTDENRLDKRIPPSLAVCHLDWIVTALQQKYKNFLGKTSEQISVVTQKPTVEFSSQNLLSRQYLDADEQLKVLRKLNYVYPFADQAGMPSKVVSSALDREFIQANDDPYSAVWNQNNDRNAIGTAYHKVFQYVNYDASSEEVVDTISGLVNEGKIPPDIAQKLDISLIIGVLNNPELRALMSRGKVYHEMPFMLFAPYNSVAKDQRFSDDVMLQGVIDLLILGENNAVVVDFKFSTHKAELLQKDYRYQLQSYRLAVEKICGIKSVESYILSIEDNTLIKL